MKITSKYGIILCILLLADIIVAKQDVAFHQTVGLQAQVTEDMTVGVKSSFFFGRHLEQTSEWYWSTRYDSTGFSGWDIAPLLEIAIGKIGNVDVIGSAELLFSSREWIIKPYDIDSTKKHEFFEITPAINLSIILPFAGGFRAELRNRFERRLFREPDLLSKFRFHPKVKLSSPEFTPVKLDVFLYYESFVQKEQYQSGWGFGLSLKPFRGFDIVLADRIEWFPDIKKTTVHVLSVDLVYTLFERE